MNHAPKHHRGDAPSTSLLQLIPVPSYGSMIAAVSRPLRWWGRAGGLMSDEAEMLLLRV